MKEDMYSYHYYRNRAIVKPRKTADFIFGSILLSGAAFAFMTLLSTFK